MCAKITVAGIDLGGTKTSVALYDEKLNRIGEQTIETSAEKGPESAFSRITETVKNLCSKNNVEISAAGICTPGPVSIKQGKILYIASINWRNVSVVELLETGLNVPVAFENDTNAAAYAERFAGAGVRLPGGEGNLIYITVSTGVGAGIIINDKIFYGARDWAGEFGHTRLVPGGRKCTCGNDGCLEMYSSGTAIEREAKKAAIETDCLLRELSGGDVSKIDCKMAAAAALQGDKRSLDIWREMAEHLGQGIAILIQLFDPQIITLGGGVTNAWPLFHEVMMSEIDRGIYADSRGVVEIRPTPLGQEAGRLGAALLALKRLKNQRI